MSGAKGEAAILAALWSILITVGCSTGPELKPPTVAEDLADAIGEVADEVQIAHEAAVYGQRADMAVRTHGVIGRYNGSRCECPPFEIYLEGRWLRVHLRWTNAVLKPEDSLARIIELGKFSSRKERHSLFLMDVVLVSGERHVAPTGNDYLVAIVSDAYTLTGHNLETAVRLVGQPKNYIMRWLEIQRRRKDREREKANDAPAVSPPTETDPNPGGEAEGEEPEETPDAVDPG